MMTLMTNSTPNYVLFGIVACLLIESKAVSQELALDEKSPPTFLTSDDDPQTIDYWPTFSPDGEKVLFSRTPRRGKAKWELFIVATTGGKPERFLKTPIPVSATRACWSLKGKVAFAGATRTRKQHLWLVNSDGSNPQRLKISNLSEAVSYPSWYADGKQLVVIDRGKERVLKRIDLETKSAVSIMNPDKFMVGMPSVSPNGKYVAFAGQKNHGGKYDQTKNTICIIDGVTTRTVETEPEQGRTPNWSPDGRWIAFESKRGSPDGRSYAIFIMDKDGKHLRRLTPYSWRANHPVWSPDGTKMVFSAVHPTQPKVSGIAILNISLKSPSK